MTQQQKIIEHLEKYGSITPWEAMTEYGIMRLASRVLELKKQGYDIETTIEYSINRDNKVCHFAKYFLKK